MSEYVGEYRSQKPGRTGGSSEDIWRLRRKGESLMAIAERMGLPPQVVVEALTVAARARGLETSELARGLLVDQLELLFQKTLDLVNMSDEKTAASHVRNGQALLLAKARLLGLENVADDNETETEVDNEIKRLIQQLSA